MAFRVSMAAIVPSGYKPSSSGSSPETRSDAETLVVVGSANYPIFDEVRALGIKVIQFDGETSANFKERGRRYV